MSISRHTAISLGATSAGLAVLVIALAISTPLSAQTLSNETFGGLSESSDEPIDIESDVLYVYDAKKLATFKGNVKAVQGTTTLRSDELDVHYIGGSEKLTGGKSETADTPAPEGGATASTTDPAATAATAAADGAKPAAKAKGNPESQINKIEARGHVVITSEDDQTTTSEWAIYDVPTQLVTVGGNVVLTQGDNVLKGDRLIIDLKTGESRFENPGKTTAGGRIRALFMPKGGAAAGSEEGQEEDGKPKKRKGKPAGAEASASDRTPAAKKNRDNGPMPIVPEYR